MTKLFASAGLWAVLSTCLACSPSATARAPSPLACQLDQTVENPLHDPKRIADMQVLVKKGLRGNVLGDKKQGVAIVIRPERGLTQEWLSHVLACDAAAPHSADSTCPLLLPGAETAVDSAQGHLVVYVRYSDPASLKRATELVSQFRATQAS